jgi:hypothetical protein
VDVLVELKIEYQRMARHVGSLAVEFDAAVARDLSACLRNWVQMEQEIDALADSQKWRLSFRHHEKPRELKRLRSRGSFVSVPLPGGAQAEGFTIAAVVKHDRALTAEEVQRSFRLSRDSFSGSKVMRFSDFLSAEGVEFKVDGVSRAVSRRDFIDRCANRLGGTHPMSVATAEDKQHWSDAFILEMFELRVGPWPAPYAVLLETGQQLLETFEFLA